MDLFTDCFTSLRCPRKTNRRASSNFHASHKKNQCATIKFSVSHKTSSIPKYPTCATCRILLKMRNSSLQKSACNTKVHRDALVGRAKIKKMRCSSPLSNIDFNLLPHLTSMARGATAGILGWHAEIWVQHAVFWCSTRKFACDMFTGPQLGSVERCLSQTVVQVRHAQAHVYHREFNTYLAKISSNGKILYLNCPEMDVLM